MRDRQLTPFDWGDSRQSAMVSATSDSSDQSALVQHRGQRGQSNGVLRSDGSDSRVEGESNRQLAVAVGGTTLAIATLVGDSLSLAPKQSPSTSPFLDVAIGPSNSYYACTANAVFEFSMTGGWTKLPDVDVVGCRGLFYSESGNLYLAGPRGARRWCAVAVREWRMAVDRTASGER